MVDLRMTKIPYKICVYYGISMSPMNEEKNQNLIFAGVRYERPKS